MRIGLITTLNTNIGDDFIREGIIQVLEQSFLNTDLELVMVNKHKPMTVYHDWHPGRIVELFPLRFKKSTANTISPFVSRFANSRFDDCDFIVQCGAPVFWQGAYHSEWAKPLMRDTVGRLSSKVPAMNLAAGSCYAWERQPDRFETSLDKEYAQYLLTHFPLTTVRDSLAQKLANSLGFVPPLLPCSAFLAALRYPTEQKEKDVVLVNYMTGAGHFEWSQQIDDVLWERQVIKLVTRLSRRHKVVFLCHNNTEVTLAKRIAPEFPTVSPKTPREYFSTLARTKVALCNRMHASVGLAGMGIPSVAVCTDSRLLMVQNLGLPTFYVKDVDTPMLESQLEELILASSREKERLLSLQEKTRLHYISLVQEQFETLGK